MNTREAGPGFRLRLATAAAAAVIALTACGSTGPATGSTAAPPPTANLKPLTSIGAGEGQLNLIAWEGYLDPSWVKPFQTQTGCQVHSTYAGTSDQMVALMKNGGGGQYDMVSSSGDADLRIIYAGDARPVNISLIPSWNQFFTAFKSPPFNTVKGVHYGVSLQWGPNVLMYSKTAFPTAPTSWSVVYDSKYKGVVTIPDNPIQIADAALYLSVHDPSLKITDPYELTQTQFTAAVNMLTQERPLVKKYWDLASQEISEFANGDATVGAGWPYQVSALKATNFPIGSVIPKEGATGWADTWMLAAKAPHPNCAYLWLRYISTPKVQAEQAVNYGETPDNMLACSYMNQIQAGACDQYHANAPAAYFNTIKLWKTPVATCDNGTPDCVPYSQWQQAWTTKVIQ